MKSIKTSALLYATIIGLLATSAVRAGTAPKAAPAPKPAAATSDSQTFKDLEQELKAAVDKVALLKADDNKASAADKMKDEDRTAAIKDINDVIQGSEKKIGEAETAKTLTASHAKHLRKIIQDAKTFLADDKKKAEAKAKTAAKE